MFLSPVECLGSAESLRHVAVRREGDVGSMGSVGKSIVYKERIPPFRAGVNPTTIPRTTFYRYYGYFK